MILPAKQSESDSANREENGVGPKPKPVSRKFDEANGSDEQDDDASHRRPAEDVISAQPRIDAIAECDKIFQAAAEKNGLSSRSVRQSD